MQDRSKRCYTYLRVSTDMQVDGYSLDAQRDTIADYAKKEGMVIVKEFNEESGSGKNTSERPVFQKMMEAVEEDKDNVGYVLVFKLSRFGRNTADILSNIEILQSYNCELYAVMDKLDSGHFSSKVLIPVQSIISQVERENINTQTMAGRWRKAKEGKWNGGFAPYGYKQVPDEKGEKHLQIAEDEADVIRAIFKQYIETEMGVRRVAIWLNNAGYKKKVRQNGTVEIFNEHFVKGVIDNPVYMGKIAYGRRKTEPIRGKRNEYHVVKQAEYEIFDGEHEAIVSEEDWYKAHAKRLSYGGRSEQKYDFEHAHQLSGILKCPRCGAGMLPNLNRKKRDDGTPYKTLFYYQCKHRKMYDGHPCDFSYQPRQESINAEVEAMVVQALQTPDFIEALQEQMNQTIDETEIKKRIEAIEKKKKQYVGSKAKLMEQMDNLDVTDAHYDAKYADMQTRLDSFYDKIASVDADLTAEKEKLTVLFNGKASMENAIRMMKFVQDKFPSLPDAVKKTAYREMLDSVEMFEKPLPDGREVKAIHFKFPVLIGGTMDKDWYADDLPGGWDTEGHDETVCLLGRRKPDDTIKVSVNMDDYYQIRDAEEAEKNPS